MTRKLILILLFKLSWPTELEAQTTKYNQFWNDFQFVTPIKGNWSNEINLGQVWTSIPRISSNLFHANAQLYARIWIHYSFSEAKLSFFTGYNRNTELIAAGQEGLPEIRSAIQGIYYFKKRPYALTARLRLEDHLDRQKTGDFEESYRVRSQLKILKALNTREITKGAVYLMASEEVFTQTAPDIFNNPRIGSNRFTVGCGYALTEDFLIEVDFSNDCYFKKAMLSSYNTLQLNLSCYNWVRNLKNALLK